MGGSCCKEKPGSDSPTPVPESVPTAVPKRVQKESTVRYEPADDISDDGGHDNVAMVTDDDDDDDDTKDDNRTRPYVKDPTAITKRSKASDKNLDKRKTLLSPHQIECLIKDGKQVARTLYDFTGSVEDNTMVISKGDVLEILLQDGDWFEARNLETGATGFVPCSYVAVENSMESYEWFHGEVSRADACKRLKALENEHGTFLIRESETVQASYSLSVLVDDTVKGRVVKHYRIRNRDFGGCYIYEKAKFASLHELVDTYSKEKDERMSSLLLHPCPKPAPQIWDLSRSTRDKWEIPREELKLIEVLGSGNFGEVWRGLWKGKTDVAVKTLKPGSMEPEKFLEEAKIMKRLQHPKIVRLYAVCSQAEPVYIVSELMPNGCLKDYLKDNPQIEFPEIIYIATQVANGMWYVERQQLIHRDLAARNILMGKNSQVKICDFGLARAIKEDVYIARQGAKCPVKWTAPEAFLYHKFTIKSDVWAFGIVVIELTNGGSSPYPGLTNREVVEKLERGYRHPQPEKCPDDVYELLLTCWDKDPDDRPSFQKLLTELEKFQAD